MTKGIKTTWECPSCGGIFTKKQVLQKIKGGFKFDSPHHCSCGRRGDFNLIDFKCIKIALYDDNEDAVLVVPKKHEKEVKKQFEKIKKRS